MIDPQGFVFLSHNSIDKPAVEEIARRLRAEGIEPWLDAWHLIPGEAWQPAIQKALAEARASVVIVGPSGIGPWQNEEMQVAIDRRVGDPSYRVVPLLLPGSQRGKRSGVPAFLASTTWVEFQRSLDEEAPFRRLVAGIEGRPPGSPPEIAVTGTNPYRGLHVFDVADRGIFFGREALTGWLLSDLRASLATRGDVRLLAVVGASGSGKSSLARAGLVAALQAGALEGSQDWRCVIFKPGANPLEALASASAQALGLADAKAMLKFQDDLCGDARILHAQTTLALRDAPVGARVVVVVDQFEEIFTLCTNETRRGAFIDALLHGAAATDGPTVVVLTLRADFLGRCAAHDRLGAALSDHQELVGPMRREELREAIEQPAWRSGCEFQPGLVDVLLDDIAAQPGALPLLQHALFELWREREGRRLTHGAYGRIGRVQGALARRADEVYRRFTPHEQVVTRRILLRLTQPGEGTEDTRRRAPLEEMIPSPESRPVIERVVGKLADERLLVTEGGTVDVTHEALIRSWPTLREWLEQDREGLREHRRLTLAAEEWQRLGRDASALYRGLRLDQALAWRAQGEGELNALEREFLDASVTLRDEERARQRALEEEREAQRQRELDQAHHLAEEAEARRQVEVDRTREAEKSRARQRTFTRIASLFAIVLLGLASTAVLLWKRGERQRLAADVRRLAAASQLELNQRFDLSLLLAATSTQMSPVWDARNSLLMGIQSHRHLVTFLAGHKAEVSSVAFSPDGKTLASASSDNTVILWDLAARKPLGEPLASHKAAVTSVAFSPDGRTLASASADQTVIVWDVVTHKPLGQPLTVHNDAVVSVAFSPDGKTLASASADDTVILWDVATRRPVARPLVGQRPAITCVAFSPDGRTLALASMDNTVILWDIATRRSVNQPLAGPISRFARTGVNWWRADVVSSVAFSPDGKRLAAAGASVILWDLTPRGPVPQQLAGHARAASSVAFSSDGRMLASASWDGTVVLWDAGTGRQLGMPLAGHNYGVSSIAFSPGTSILASAGEDATVVLWDVAAGDPLAEPLAGHQMPFLSVAFSSDGSTLASASGADGTVVLWDVTTRKPLGEVATSHKVGISSVAFSRDGTALASASSWNRSVTLWDLATLKPLGKPLTSLDAVVWSVALRSEVARWDVAFSPDGSTLALPDRKMVTLLDVPSRTQLGGPLVGHEEEVSSVAFSPDGETLASASDDRTVRLWDVAARKPLGQSLVGHQAAVRSVAFSPDGKILASASEDQTVMLWDVAAREPLGQPLVGHKANVWSVAFSLDGTTLASASDDQTVMLWDVAARKPLGRPLTGHRAEVLSAAFSPDGKTLASGGRDTTVILWDVAIESWRDQACRIANRNLTCAEWREHMPDRTYRKVCEQFPEPECP